MVNGELKCYGSLQHLKIKYGDGFTLLVKIAYNSDPEQLLIKEFITFFLTSFEYCVLKENRDGFLSFHINNNSAKMFTSIFYIIEENKKKFSIEYYVITQTNLEQIFLNLASKQISSMLRNVPKKRIKFC